MGSGFRDEREEFPPLISSSSSSGAKGGLSIVEKVVEAEINSGIVAPSTFGEKGENGNPKSIKTIKLGSGSKGVNTDLVITSADLGMKNSIEGKDWRALFPIPRAVTPQKAWNYTSPVEVNGRRVVAAHTKNLSAGMKSCEDLVVGFCVGKKVSFSAVQLAVSKLWKLKKEVSIKLYGECAFIFEFSDEEDRRQALETGSFYIGSKLFTLRPWTQLIEKSIADIKSVPIWVNIYGVPLHMWDVDGLSLIASYLGKPLLADDYTINKTRLSYARICIEIGIDFEYPSSIPLLIDDTIYFDLPVEYHWRPPKCDICNVFGHVVRNFSRKLKTRWTPKKIVYPGSHFETPNEVDLGPEIVEPVKVVPEVNRCITVEKNVEFALPSSINELISEKRGKQTGVDGENLNTEVTKNDANHNREISGRLVEISGSRTNVVHSSSTVGTNISVSTVIPPTGNDGAGTGEDNDKGEWIVAGKKNKQGNNKGGHIGVVENKNGAKKTRDISNSKAPSPPKKGTGVFITTVANGNVQKIQSPKRNPFMVYSDFKEDSRFPINRTKEMEAKSTPSRVIAERVPSEVKGLVEEAEENDNLNDCDFEKKLQYMSLEDQIIKRKQRELYRLQWNGNEGNSSKGGCNNQPMGRGLRSQTKKRNF